MCTRKPAEEADSLYTRAVYTLKVVQRVDHLWHRSVNNLLREEGNDVQDDLRGRFHALQRDELHLAVEIQPAGEDVRAGETLEGEVRAVGAAGIFTGMPAISIAFTAFSTTK